eukprot:TRINITY_DN15839_c0_g1_i1.p1 TRINITY_DN15839_c0_g1~~TRINITY_DN15839_c0_g1_i1.p1  ORF type:complete len:203 (+),score=40.44 TRINITY_DN15839_c0_g1_i1:58-666(+)
MKILSVIIFKHTPSIETTNPIILSQAFELSSFSLFQRSSIQEALTFVSREVVRRSSYGHSIVLHKEYLCHVYLSQSGITITCITDDDYPKNTAFLFQRSVFETFTKSVNPQTWTNLTRDKVIPIQGLYELLLKFQNPREVDKIEMVKEDIEETKKVLVQTIDKLLERGQKLEELAVLSEDLSFQSKAFAKRAEELNSCCVIL